MKNLDLFGGQTEVVPENNPLSWKAVKGQRNYRLAENKKESCKSCSHLVKKDYHDKIYYKCELMSVLASATSDIRLKNTCDLWKIKVITIDDVTNKFEKQFENQKWEFWKT